MSRPSLQISEWFVIYFFFALLTSLIVIAKISSYKANKYLGKTETVQSIFVEVSGEVARPGSYEVRKGTTCRDILKRAKPKKFADLSKIDLDAPSPNLLVIAPLEEIHIFVKGEGVSAPSEWTLKPGSRVSELKSKIGLTQDADPTSLQSRRMLMDGETIWVEKRK